MAITMADFRILNMECCQTIQCWVNPRLPIHCSECGKLCYPAVRGWVVNRDERAVIKHKEFTDHDYSDYWTDKYRNSSIHAAPSTVPTTTEQNYSNPTNPTVSTSTATAADIPRAKE